jgi:hypothetical protein
VCVYEFGSREGEKESNGIENESCTKREGTHPLFFAGRELFCDRGVRREKGN